MRKKEEEGRVAGKEKAVLESFKKRAKRKGRSLFPELLFVSGVYEGLGGAGKDVPSPNDDGPGGSKKKGKEIIHPYKASRAGGNHASRTKMNLTKEGMGSPGDQLFKSEKKS